MRAGAHDVVFRDRPDRLLPAIDREVRSPPARRPSPRWRWP
jgi:hypothetical protein